MSEAKKLSPEDHSASGAPEPLVFAPEAKGPAVDLRVATALPEGLPPLSQQGSPLELRQEPETALLDVRKPAKKRRGTSSALILMLVGLTAFVCGVALASAVLLGILDLQTGWVKDLLHSVKDLIRSKPH